MGKTFSGDWDTLFGNTLINFFYIRIGSIYVEMTISNVRMIGDDSGFATLDDTTNLTDHCTLLGASLEVTRITGLQSFNSQYALLDKSGRAYMLPQTAMSCLKKFAIPLPKPMHPDVANIDNKYSQTFLSNVIYITKNSGDPLAEKVAAALMEHYNAKKTTPNEFRKLINKPYKPINSFNHYIDRHWANLYALEAYGVTLTTLDSIKIDIYDRSCLRILAESSPGCGQLGWALSYDRPHDLNGSDTDFLSDILPANMPMATV
jgi:hypothetical protein